MLSRVDEQGWHPTISIVRASPTRDEVPARASSQALDRLGRFTILRELGRGGMGKVYVGYDHQLARKVALKLLHRAATGEPGQHRLLREAQALARLSHPHVVQVHEVGETDDGMFIAMELVEGETLSAWARGPGADLDWRGRLDVLVQAGRGLAAAHAVGLVHRDFKPHNVLVGQDGRARVLDFGLVRQSGALDQTFDGRESTESIGSIESTLEESKGALELSLTEQGTIMGTPAYMAPEQHEGRACDAAADQYAFCVTALELLHGRPAFAPAPMRALAAAKQGRELQLELGRAGMPRAIDEALLRGLAPAPAQRWPSLDALLDALEQLARPSVRRWPSFVGGVAGVAVVLGVALLPREEGEREPCAIDEHALAGVWDEPRALALADALGDEFGVAQAQIDGWTQRWLDTRKASCEATRVAHTQSEAMLDRREACLLRERAELDAIVDVLVRFDGRRELAAVLDTLPDLGACSVEALDAEGDAAKRSPEAEAGFAALASARTLLRVGEPARARETVEQVTRQAVALDDLRLQIEAEVVRAEILERDGNPNDALAMLREATRTAHRAGLGDLETSVRVRHAKMAAGDSGELAVERWLVDEAQLALDTVGRADDPRAVTLEAARARIAEQAGDYDQAIAAYERAYVLAEGRLDPSARVLLRVGIGTARYRAGDYVGARSELEACLESVRASWGARARPLPRIHFDLAMVESDLGNTETARRHLDAAIDLDRTLWGADSLEIARDRFAAAYLDFGAGAMASGCATVDALLPTYERELGPEHDELGQLLTAIGMCRFFEDDLAGAESSYARALAIQQRALGERHYEVGLLHSNLAEIDLARGNLVTAELGYRRAADIFAATVPEQHPLHAYALRGLGTVWLETAQPRRAIEALERALALADASNPIERAEIEFALARAQVAEHGPTALGDALVLAARARQSFIDSGAASRAAAVEDWQTRDSSER
jgi:tetratricopeptide (TPR) repeat protein/tRNA A-37 threonylcarbamoyl transferase component Bud32